MLFRFLSTLSLRRATSPFLRGSRSSTNFYPRSPCGERRQAGQHRHHFVGYFYPRSPCGERPGKRHCGRRRQRFLSTLSLRRATGLPGFHAIHTDISIHALLAESDVRQPELTYTRSKFLSTLSLRRATTPMYHSAPVPQNFYPRSPCGERRLSGPADLPADRISIHALLAESDVKYARFNDDFSVISIHALLAESDRLASTSPFSSSYFYPRSPCGERHIPATLAALLALFLSTLSLRRATILFTSNFY